MLKRLQQLFAAPALPVPVYETAARNAEITLKTSTIGAPRQKRSFQAADINRLTASFKSSDVAINALLESQLPIIRARSRNLSYNTALGRRFLSLVKNNIVGADGFKLQSRCGDYRNGKWVLDDLDNSAIETHFKTWSRAEHCDVTGQSNFTDICRMLAEQLARDGEILVKEIIGTKDTPYRYQLQVLNIDRLDIHYRGTAANGNTIRMGVERNAAGKPTAYYVLVRNPNDSLNINTQTRERIDAKDIIHRFIRIDPEQVRGVPWAHAIMTGQNMLHMFEEAAVQAAVVGASNMGFLKPPAPGEPGYAPPADGEGYGSEFADSVDDYGNLEQDAIGGSMRILPPGWGSEKFDPAYPHAAFDPFVQSRKRDMASGVDVAHHNLSGDMSGVNYSSARIAELQERDCWRAGQQFLINAFVLRVAERWLEMSLLAGAITTPNGSKLPATKIDKFKQGLGFTARGWDWVDPLKEVNAAAKAIEEGLATRSQIVASKGGDFEENIIELEREMALLKKHNIKLGAEAPANPNAVNNTDGAEDADN